MKNSIRSKSNSILKKWVPSRSIMKRFRLFPEAFHCFRSVFLTYAMIAVLSSVFFLTSFVNPAFGVVLSASSHTPWGIITSIFIHGGIEPLLNNLIGLFALFLLFSMSNLNSSNKERQMITVFLPVTIFLTAIVSNFLWIMLVSNGFTSGLSGVVFATEGALMAFSLRNSMTMFRLSKLDTKEKKRTQTLWVLNLLVFLSIFIQILSNPHQFLNVAPKVNSFVHGIAFLSNYSLTAAWFFFKGNPNLAQLKEHELLNPKAQNLK